MIYVYDKLEKEDMSSYTYMDRKFYLASKSFMGELAYYTYKDQDNESLLLIPCFARQFYEAAKLYQTIKTARSRRAIEMRIVNRYRTRPDTDIINEAEDSYSFRVNYKNISFVLSLNQGQFRIAKEFTIMSGNIFGNGLRVSVEENPEILKYCEY